MSDPNRKERIEPLNDKARYTEVGGSVSGVNEPGYRRLGRRPRNVHFDECMSLEDADMIEEVFDDMGPTPGGY